MKTVICRDKGELGRRAAKEAADVIRAAIAEKGESSIIVATGASQFDTLAALVQEDVDWGRVTGFHLDEYVGMSESHPASFRKYLKERFVEKVPLKGFHYVNGEGDAQAECDRLGKILSTVRIDVALVGIRENGHLAFNDPPADFQTEASYLLVNLDEACRRQQMGEGWFKNLDEVPRQAISMGIRQIMKSGCLICSVPDERKARAVKNTLEAPVSPDVPASIMREHACCSLYLDPPSACLLENGG